MPNRKTLYEMSQTEITQTDPAALAQVDTLAVAQTLPRAQRLRLALEQLGNPYCFCSGNVPVRVRFMREDRSFEEALLCYFSRRKRG